MQIVECKQKTGTLSTKTEQPSVSIGYSKFAKGKTCLHHSVINLADMTGVEYIADYSSCIVFELTCCRNRFLVLNTMVLLL